MQNKSWKIKVIKSPRKLSKKTKTEKYVGKVLRITGTVQEIQYPNNSSSRMSEQRNREEKLST